MSDPLSPPPATASGRDELPPYLSNGLVGLRVLDVPLLAGTVLVSGFSGLHPEVQVEAGAQAPYPLAGDICIGDVWLTSTTQQAEFVDQAYDFATGELTTRFRFHAADATATVEVLTLCSHKQPALVLQEVAVEVDAACDLALRAIIDISKIHGRLARRTVVTPGRPNDAKSDGSLAWEGLGGKSSVGLALWTELLGDAQVERKVLDWGLDSGIATEYRLRARPGRRYRLHQVASIVPSVMHRDPDRHATRLAAKAGDWGFDRLREENRIEWSELWKGRILIDADDERWQRLADAAFYYLNASTHAASPSSTSIYGLAQWRDYHYYYGHVMWDVDFFCIPPLVLVQPEAARALLRFRAETRGAARSNAKLNGRQGLQFPWEAGPEQGEESAPGSGAASWYEDHVSLDIAWAFSQLMHGTDDGRFAEDEAAPVLFGVADWITSRVSRSGRRYDFRETMGIAEREKPADNDAFTILGARIVLGEAIALAERTGGYVAPAWTKVLEGLAPPVDERSNVILNHDGWTPEEDKGATPGPLAALFPMWADIPEDRAQATLRRYLDLAPEYIGSPMLSPLYGVWAAWAGDRAASARLLDEGYAKLHADRYLQTLEMDPAKFPDTPTSGPFFANLGGFLTGLLYGFPGIRLGAGDPATWPARPVVLPAGWRSIEVERAWVRQQPARIVARHGDERAAIELPGSRSRARKAAA
jgi:trehalose/maltose hydrolase-like predicted phosphorylase